MADHSIDSGSCHSLRTCSDEFLTGFGHSVIFPALVEERERTTDVRAPELIKSCLRKAGLRYHSLESLQLHGCFFHHCFVLSETQSNQEIRACKCNDVAMFTSHDYFEALMDTELGWFQYYRQMIPFIRLDLAVNIAFCLDTFCRQQQSAGKLALGLTAPWILLLTSTLEMFFSIVYDLFSGSEWNVGDQQAGNTAGECSEMSYPSPYYSLGRQLVSKTAKCLNILFNNLFGNGQESEGKESSGFYRHTKVIEDDSEIRKYFVEFVSLTMLVVDPLSRVQDICDALRELRVFRTRGQVSDGGSSTNLVDIKHLKNASMLCRQYQESCETDECEPKVKKTTESELQDCSFIDIECSDKTTDRPLADNKQDCSEFGDMPTFLLKSLRRNVSTKVFVNIVHYYSRGDDKIHKRFYNNLSEIIEYKSHIEVSDHQISRHKLFSRVEKLLLGLNPLKGNQTENSSVFITTSNSAADANASAKMSRLLTAVAFFPDRTRFSLSAAQEVLSQEGRVLTGEHDLVLVKTAVDELMPGWIDLVTLGMQNSEFMNWWDLGFLDIVMEKVDYLSSEVNTIHVLRVLHCLSLEEIIHWEPVKKMTKLLTAMLHRLPSLLQEKVVLWTPLAATPSNASNLTTDQGGSTTTPLDPHPCESTQKGEGGQGDLLWRLKGQSEVMKDITSLLNRLTADNVLRFLPQVLMLCLYSKEVVVTQALRTAVDNKGQVTPVVKLLRHMPAVCNVLDIRSGHPLLMSCFGRVMSDTQLDERCEENVVALLTVLTQGYDRVVDTSTDTSQWKSDGVVSMKELMDTLVIPTIDTQLTAGARKANVETSLIAKVASNQGLEIQLPVTTVLQCFASIVQTVPLDQISSLQGVVMVQALTGVCLRHWNAVCEVDDGGAIQALDGKAIWQRAKTCLDCLMDRMQKEVMMDSSMLERLLESCCRHGGLPALALMYPLLQHNSDLQMVPILQLVVNKMAATQDTHAVLNVLLRLGQVNSAICQTIIDFIATDSAMLELSLNGQLLTAVVAEVLAECSGVDDVSRMCRLLQTIVSNLVVGREEEEEEVIRQQQQNQLVDDLEWNSSGDKDIQTRCLCIQYLTHGLMCVVSSGGDLTHTSMAVVNYQAACQALLELEGQTTPSGHHNQHLMLFTFVQCCSVLCLPHGDNSNIPPQTFQGLHVLAMTLLNSLTSTLEKEQKERESAERSLKQSRDKKGQRLSGAKREKGDNSTGSKEQTDHVGFCESVNRQGGEKLMGRVNETDSSKGVGKGQGRESDGRKWMTVDKVLCLRDVVTCIVDDSIGKQLEKQLVKMYAFVSK